MISRQDAYALLLEHNSEQHLIHHALEAEAVMRGLAEKLGHDPELWGITGLLHDLDYSKTKDNTARHGLDTAEMLDGKLPDEALYAIKAHNEECTGVKAESQFDFALRAGESVTGLVHANALVRPTGMEGMKAKSLKKKMKEKAFAASVDRERIREYEKIGLEAGDFFTIAIQAIDGIKGEVGLG